LAVNYELSMVRGDTFSFDVNFSEFEDKTIDGLFFTVKRKEFDKKFIIQKSLEDGITTEAEYSYRVRVAPDDTRTVIPGSYVYDLQVCIGDDVYTILKGNFSIQPDVTRGGEV